LANPITIRHLLNHTSGLRDYCALQEVAGRLERIDNLGVLRLMSAQRELNFESGANYEYSNSDYVLLGLLVDRASGLSLAEYAKRELFGPLGMDRSWFQSDSAGEFKPAQGYESRDGSLREAAPPPETVGDGGMYSAVSDLLRWMQNLERPAESQRTVIREIQSRARLTSGEMLPHASGLFRNRYHGRVTISHNGAVSGFQADVVQFPRERLSVVCLCNRGDVNAASLSRAIAEIFLREAPAPKAPGKSLPADLSGKWESSQGFILSTGAASD